MNVKLKRYIKLMQQLQMLDYNRDKPTRNRNEGFAKIYSEASRVRVQKNLHKADTRIV